LRIDFSFRDVMLRYLDRTRWYSERDPHSPRPVRRYITDEELGGHERGPDSPAPSESA